jgi:hypothetical protein
MHHILLRSKSLKDDFGLNDCWVLLCKHRLQSLERKSRLQNLSDLVFKESKTQAVDVVDGWHCGSED